MFIGLIVILSGCNYNEKINLVFFEQDNYRIYLYSNGENENIEHDYLSAILNLKITHPEIVNEMVVQETSSKDVDKNVVGEYPALLITKHGETVDMYSGEQNKEEIFNRLESLLVSNNQTAYSKQN